MTMSRTSDMVGKLSSRDIDANRSHGMLSGLGSLSAKDDGGPNGSSTGCVDRRGSNLYDRYIDQREHDDLKDLMLANLDLIQSQQELLLANERTILSLNKENEMLKCRLDRIERRLSLVCTKTSPSNSSSFPTDIGSSPSSNQRNNFIENREKRKSTFEITERYEKNVDKRISCENRIIKESTTEIENIEEVSSSKTNAKAISCKSKSVRQSSTFPRRNVSSSLQMEKDDGNGTGKRIMAMKRVRRNSELLMTDVLYYVPTTTTSSNELEDEELEVFICHDQIVVPSWRVKHLSSLYVIEGTENLDERIFIKRHQKSETEEKRRKRWDVQRFKDLNLLRKQQLKDEAVVKKNTKQDVTTFFPQLEKALFIEVNDFLPVSAFGFPIPSIDSKEFQLRWFNPDKEESKNSKKSRKT